MSEKDNSNDPDWDTALNLALTPAGIIYCLFNTAEAVHTGWETCIDHALIVSELTALDELSDNYCRLVEQEYQDEERSDVSWHDWTVELKLGATFISAHWRAQVGGAPYDWDWCIAQSEEAFTRACLLVGKPVRRGLAVEQNLQTHAPTRTHH